MCPPLIYRLQVEKSSHTVKFTFLFLIPVNYFMNYRFSLKINIYFSHYQQKCQNFIIKSS